MFYHEHMMRVDLEGNLANLRRSRKRYCEWTDDGGPVERVVAILWIEKWIAQGWRFMPMGDCDHWDPVAGKCLGHEG
jgi:hypothetical protein